MDWLTLAVAFILGAATMYAAVVILIVSARDGHQYHGEKPMALRGNSPRPKVNPMAKVSRKPVDLGVPWPLVDVTWLKRQNWRDQ